MKAVFLLLSSISVSMLFGCATITPEQRAKWDETTPVCFSDSDCKTKWAAARQWVQNNSGYKIQIYSDDLIETYNAQKSDTKIAVSVSKNPIGKAQNGEQINTIPIRVSCGNIFGCIPSIHDSIMSFNKYVSQSDINDPECYVDMLKNSDKPKLGIFPLQNNTTKNFIIKRVCSGSPASISGIKANDVITKINGKSITSENDLKNSFNEIQYGDVVSIGILRDDSPLDLTIISPNKKDISKLTSKMGSKMGETVVNLTSLEQKLEELLRLYENDLITKDEYDSKKKQLLSEM